MLIKNNIRFIILLFCAGLSLSSEAQILDSVLLKYSLNYMQEKAYLQYDKSSYYAGETIWFKAYVMENFSPAEGSKTLYVDWVNDKGLVLLHSVSPLVSGVSNGQFDIPSDFAGNFIHVRAYTKWMLNFDTAFLYTKDIRVFSKNSASEKIIKPATIPVLEFFPEGGDAVAGVNNKIAFKATDQWGLPVKIKGVVQNNKGITVDSIRSIHDGMGYFSLVPQEGMSYTAKWKDEKGGTHSTDLPAVKASGVSMQVTLSGTKRYVSVNSNNLIPDNLKQLHLVGTLNQAMAFKTDINFTAGSISRKIIPTEKLPSGILTITLFDANWNAIAERITFINNHDYYFEPAMEVKQWGLSKRKRNEIQISVPDSLQEANLSIAVTDAAIEKDTTTNIISQFLLTSDIRGKVYNPAYYFLNNNDSVEQQLDLVMLTNGWRRFKWEDVVKGKFPAIRFPKDTSYLSLSGKVFGVVKSQLSGSESIALILKGKDSASGIVILPIHTDATFGDPRFIIFDTMHVYYSLKSKFLRQAEAKFMIDRLPTPNYTAFSKNFINYNPLFDTSGIFHHINLASETAHMLELQNSKVMETVTVTATTKSAIKILDEKYAKGLFSGGDSYQFDLVNDKSAFAYQNIFMYLQGKVAGLTINTNSGTPSLSWRGSTPDLFLDEMKIDADMLSGIPASDVAYIKVFRPPFMGSFGGGAGGAIAIYTRKGDDRSGQGSTGLSSNIITGYTPIKQFYSPNYDKFDQRNEQKDIRTTIYWNPFVTTTSQKHTITLTFYNNDVAKSFRVVIEGMSKEGLLTHYEQVME